MTSRISVNIHGLNVPDENRLLRFLDRLQPQAVVVLDSLDLSRNIKKRLPNTTVIWREFGSKGDGDLHKQSSAVEWLNHHTFQARDGIVQHVLNEPPFDEAVIRWLTELLREAATRRIPLIVGNWAVGNPIPEQWPMARELLQLLVEHRDLFILGLHEYAGGVVTSGLYGGYPDNAGVAPGKPGGMNLVRPSSWPNDVSNVTRYHMGRFKFLVDYCKAAKLELPRIILTEHGFDDTSDIKAWLDTLKCNAPYLNVRGWKTLQDQWSVWFGPLGWTPERAYFEQLKWANETIYAHSPVEAQCIFCWGHSSKDWFQFDIAEAFELQSLLEGYVQPQEKPMPTPVSFPENLGEPMQRVVSAAKDETFINGRTGPGTDYEDILDVPNGATVKVWKESARLGMGRLWYPVEYNGRRFWLPQVGYNADRSLRTFEQQFLPVIAAPPTTPPAPTTPPVIQPPSKPEPALPPVTVIVARPDELQTLIDMELREIARLSERIVEAQQRVKIITSWKQRMEGIAVEEEELAETGV